MKLSPRFSFKHAREWLTGKELPVTEQVEIEIPPGESRFVEFTSDE